MVTNNNDNNKQKKKKFLMILLFLIIILLPITIITIETIKKNIFINNIEKSIESYQKYSSKLNDISRVEVTDDRLLLENNKLLSGTLISINKNDFEVYYVTDGKYCASGKLGKLTITKGPCQNTALDDLIMKTFILDIDPNNGRWNNNEKNQKIKLLNKKEFYLSNPEKNNSLFKGWNINIVGNIYNTNDGFLTTHLSAVWDNQDDVIFNQTTNIESFSQIFTEDVVKKININKMLFSIDPNGGVWDNTKEITNIEIKNNDKINLINPEKIGYDFKGWKITTTGKISELNNGKLEIKLVADYEPHVYSLKINLNNDSISEEKIVKMTIGETYKLETPVRKGYKFKGWKIDNELSKIIDSNQKFIMGNQDTEIVAEWAKIHKLTIDLDGGNSSQKLEHEIAEGDTLLLEKPKKENLIFYNWQIIGNDSEIENDNFIMGKTDTTIIAKWANASYLLNINLNNGRSNQQFPKELSPKETLTLEKPNRLGYVFKGWDVKGENSKVEDNVLIMGTENTDVMAKWNLENYKLLYNLSGGFSDNRKDYTINTETFSLSEAIKEGHTFIGWTEKNDDIPSKDIVIKKGTTGDKKYTAHYNKNAYILTADANNGKMDLTEGWTIRGSNLEKNILFDDEYDILPNPIREGYTFIGWYNKLVDGEKVDSNSRMKASKQTIYAYWQPTNYTIKYDINGGEKIENTIYTIETDTFTLPIPVRENYEFKGWIINNNDSPNKEIIIKKGTIGDKQYTAIWEPNVYEIKYNLNGGEITNKTNYTVETDTFVLNNPTRPYYSFIGWTGSNGLIPNYNIEITKGSYGNRIYNANWNPILYAINYELDGGTLDGNIVTNYNIETSTFNLPVPHKKGYIFEGWYLDEEFSGEKQDSIEQGSNGNKIFYAKWEEIIYQITYNLDDGILAEDSPQSYTIETDTFELPIPKKINYQFKGWYTNSEYTSSMSFTIEKGTTGDKVYYAKWEPLHEEKGTKIYDVVAKNAYSDNKSSLFVTDSNGIDFSKGSGITNGLGVYTLSETLNDEYPIYYYRGLVENNNVIFGKKCWKIVRTTETGGTKLIYNGVPTDGSCDNSGDATLIGKDRYNTVGKSGSIGYSNGVNYSLTQAKYTTFEKGTKLAKNVSYSNGEYLLEDIYEVDDNFEENIENILKEYHYTCASTSNSCDKVRFTYYIRINEQRYYYILLTNGDTGEKAYNNSILNSSNSTNSNAKNKVETWFKDNLTAYESDIEDTVWCSDRSVQDKAGWEIGGDITESLYFGAANRNIINNKPSLDCPNVNDRFTKNTENGNGKNLYPIGLITADEAALSGYVWYKSSGNNYLNSNAKWWTMSPCFVSANNSYVFIVYSMLDSVHVGYTNNNSGGLRPSISLKNGTIIKEGNGSVEKPFIISNE